MAKIKQYQGILSMGCTVLISAVPMILYSKALGKRMVGSPKGSPLRKAYMDNTIITSG